MSTKAFKVEELAALDNARTQKPSVVPMLRGINMLLHVRKAGEVSIHVRAFDGNYEFVQYILSDADGDRLTGVMAEGRTIRLNG